MKYFYQKPELYFPMYGETYTCNHPLYNRCTLYLENNRGLAVIQERFNPETKTFYWSEIDPWLANDIYLARDFRKYFLAHAKACTDGIFPTIPVRRLMWALRIKPLEREWWEESVRKLKHD